MKPGRSRIPFYKMALADLEVEPIATANDLLATLTRLRGMLKRADSTTGRVHLTPAGLKALTGTRKIDAAWRVIDQLVELGAVDAEKIEAGSKQDRAVMASILDRKWADLQGLARRVEQSRAEIGAPPNGGPPIRERPAAKADVLQRPGPARTDAERREIERSSAEAKARIERARLRVIGGGP